MTYSERLTALSHCFFDLLPPTHSYIAFRRDLALKRDGRNLAKRVINLFTQKGSAARRYFQMPGQQNFDVASELPANYVPRSTLLFTGCELFERLAQTVEAFQNFSWRPTGVTQLGLEARQSTSNSLARRPFNSRRIAWQ